jgi:hypothetical protein
MTAATALRATVMTAMVTSRLPINLHPSLLGRTSASGCCQLKRPPSAAALRFLPRHAIADLRRQQHPAGTAASVAGTAASPPPGALTARGENLRQDTTIPRVPVAAPSLLALADKELRSSVERADQPLRPPRLAGESPAASSG